MEVNRDIARSSGWREVDLTAWGGLKFGFGFVFGTALGTLFLVAMLVVLVIVLAFFIPAVGEFGEMVLDRETQKSIPHTGR